MAHSVLLVVLGLLCLSAGAEGLVRGGSALALGLGLSPLFIGLTLVAYGTSSPEMMVSVLAALGGQSDIATGNVIGSNIFNIGVVLGLAAVVTPLACGSSVIRRELPVMILITLLLLLASLGGRIGRIDGAVLVFLLCVYTTWIYRKARQVAHQPHPVTSGGRPWLVSLAVAAGGIALLVLGARWMVHGATEIARTLGVSETVIGLTLVATGTSLPELATSLVAARKREMDIAIGTVVGSNIFNVLGILGLTGLLHPIELAPHIVHFDIPAALTFGVVTLPMMLTGRRITRLEGAFLLIGYATYVAVLFIRNGAGL